MAKVRKFGADPREEGTTGGPRTTPMNPTRKETLRKAEEENAKNREKARKTPVPKYAKGGKVSNFGTAFRAARAAGKKEFTFGGKSYTTKLKEEAETPKPKAAEKPAPKKDEPEIVVTGRRKPTNTQQMQENIGKPRNTAADTAKFRAMQEAKMADTASRGRGSSRGAGTVGTSNIRMTGNRRQMLENLGFKSGGKAEKGSDMMYAKGGKTMKMAKGGSASKRADGIAKKGKTKAMMPKMAKGGKMKGC